MTIETKKIIAQALKLSAKDKATLLNELMRDLDSDQGAEKAWQKEADRRLSEIAAGKVRTISWENVKSHLAGC